jgi:hypothetical protein
VRVRVLVRVRVVGLSWVCVCVLCTHSCMLLLALPQAAARARASTRRTTQHSTTRACHHRLSSRASCARATASCGRPRWLRWTRWWPSTGHSWRQPPSAAWCQRQPHSSATQVRKGRVSAGAWFVAERHSTCRYLTHLTH